MLEGDWTPKRLVLLEFEDLDAAKRWYDSPDRAARDCARVRRNAEVAVDGV